MVKNHTKTANIQPTLASEPIGHILPCSSLYLETETTGKYAIPNDGYIPEQSMFVTFVAFHCGDRPPTHP